MLVISPSIRNLLSSHKRTLLCVLFAFLYSFSITLAVPPSTKYAPGETLDPTCAPSDTNCSVQVLADQATHTGSLLTTDGNLSSWTDTLSGSTITFTDIPNSALVNQSITINGNPIALGGSVANLALTTGTLSQFAATTSTELSGVISDETGSGVLVFGTSPTLTSATAATALTLSFTPTTSAGTYTILSRNTTTGVVETVASTTFPSGSGTTNYIAKFTGTNTLGNSSIFDNGTSVGVGDATPASLFTVGSGDLFQVNSSGAITALTGITTTGGYTQTGSSINTFSGRIVSTQGNSTRFFESTSATTGYTYAQIKNTGGEAWLGIENSTGGELLSGSSAYATILSAMTATSLHFGTNSSIRFTIDSSGNLIVSDLAGVGNRCLYADSTGQINVKGFDCGSASGGDNLGDHVATQNIVLGSNWLSSDGGNEGIRVDASGNVGVGTGSPNNTYQGLTIYGTNPSLSLSGSGIGSWNWIQYMTSAGVNNFSSGVNQTAPAYYGIVTGAGLDNPSFAINASDDVALGGSFNGGTFTGASMVIKGTGNVGIGTTAPDTKFHVDNQVNTPYQVGATIVDATTFGAIGLEVSNYKADADYSAIRLATRSSGSAVWDIANIYQTTAAGDLAFRARDASTTSKEVMRLTYGGNVGIGTGSPVLPLTVGKTQVANTIVPVMKLTTTGSYSGPGSAGAGAALQFGQYHDTYPNWVLGQIASTRTGVAWGGDIVFSINNNSAEDALSERMRITSAGNVGIGTTSPSNPLHIKSENPTLRFEDNTDGAFALMGNANDLVGGTAGNLAIRAETGLHFSGGGNAQHVYISSVGNVGIGTTSPGYLLNIVGPSAIMAVQDSGANGTRALVQATNTDVRFGNTYSSSNVPILFVQGGSVEVMRIDTTGNVGIGTTNPGYKLDVNGAIGVNGYIQGHAATYLDIYMNTADASDNKIVRIGGGGDVSSNRGAFATFYGNESVGNEGDLYLTAGGTGDVLINNGNVGIGTTAPGGKLDVNAAGSQIGIKIGYIAGAYPSDYYAAFTHAGNGNGVGSLGGLQIIAQAATDLQSGQNIVFAKQAGVSTPAVQMIILNNGNVGIGTTSPTNYKLEVVGTVKLGAALNGGRSGGDYDGIGYNFRTTATGGVYNYDVADTSSRLDFYNGGFRFKTSASGLVGNPITYSDTMTINNNGNVGIGTTSPGTKLEVAGNVTATALVLDGYTVGRSSGYWSLIKNDGNYGILVGGTGLNQSWYDNNTHTFRNSTGGAIYMVVGASGVNVTSLGTGTVYSNGGILTNSNPSDRRLKNTINPLEYGLEEIRQLEPKTYYYNDDEQQERLQYGFLAQDVQSIMPELVRPLNDGTGHLGLEINGIYVTMVRAIQELDIKVQVLPEFDDDGSMAAAVAEFLAGIAEGIANIGRVNADKVQTDELCLEDVCVTRDQFMQMLENSGSYNNTTNTPTPEPEPTPSGDGSPVEEPTSDPTPEETIPPAEEPAPEPEPEPTPEPPVEESVTEPTP